MRGAVKESGMAKSTKASKRAQTGSNRDLKAIALIRESGLLNPDAKLEEVLRLFDRTGGSAKGTDHFFIFRNYVLSGCL
jgi:hypothetical protein